MMRLLINFSKKVSTKNYENETFTVTVEGNLETGSLEDAEQKLSEYAKLAEEVVDKRVKSRLGVDSKTTTSKDIDEGVKKLKKSRATKKEEPKETPKEDPTMKRIKLNKQLVEIVGEKGWDNAKAIVQKIGADLFNILPDNVEAAKLTTEQFEQLVEAVKEHEE